MFGATRDGHDAEAAADEADDHPGSAHAPPGGGAVAQPAEERVGED